MNTGNIAESFISIGIILLIIAGVIALIAMAYLFVQSARMIKDMQTKVNPLLDEAHDAMVRINPVIDDVKELTESAKPLLGKVDPLMDRITLSIDAVNLEIMRVDQILEDVNTITGNITRATDSLDTLSSLPLDLVTNITSRLKSKIAPFNRGDGTACDSVVSAVDMGVSAVEDRVEGIKAQKAEKRAARDEAQQIRFTSQAQANLTSLSIKDAVSVHTSIDTEFVNSDQREED